MKAIVHYTTQKEMNYEEAVKTFISIASDLVSAEEPIIKITKHDDYGIYYELDEGLSNLDNVKFHSDYVKNIRSPKEYFDIAHDGEWPSIWTDDRNIFCLTADKKIINIGFKGIRIDYKRSSYIPKTYAYIHLMGDIDPEDNIDRTNLLCNNEKFFKAFNYNFDRFKKILLKYKMLDSYVAIDKH